MSHQGTGYVEQLPSGRWRARLPRALGGGDRQAGETFDTQAQALEWLRAALEELEGGRSDRGTLRAWGALWLERRERRGLSDVATDRGRWARLIDGSDLADLPLRALTPPRIAAWARWLAELPRLRQVLGGKWEPDPRSRLSRQTQVHARNLLRSALDAAVLDGLIPSNPAAAINVEPADVGEDADAWTWLTTTEIGALTSCTAVPLPARLLYQVAIYTGLRAGELWALRWEQVRLVGDRPQLTVAKSNKRRSTKSGKVRPVPLLPAALAALQQWHQNCGEPRSGLVWPGADGRQRPRGDDGGWADRSRGKQPPQRGHRSLAGINREVRFHDLRHTCASHLIQGSWGRRWTLEEVRDFLGHSSITVTQRYAHQDPAALHAAAAATQHGLHAAAAATLPAAPKEGSNPPPGPARKAGTPPDEAAQRAVITAERGAAPSSNEGIALALPAQRSNRSNPQLQAAAITNNGPLLADQPPITAPRTAPCVAAVQARSPTARPAGLEPATHGLEGRVFPTVKALCGPLVVSSSISLRRGSLCQYP